MEERRDPQWLRQGKATQRPGGESGGTSDLRSSSGMVDTGLSRRGSAWAVRKC